MRFLSLILVFVSTTARAETWKVTTSETLNNLGVVSIYSYGTTGQVREIAKWNGLRRPYRLKLGQSVILREKPTLTPEEGLAAVAAMWRGREMVKSLAEKVKPSAPTRDLFDRAVQAKSPETTLTLLRRNRERHPEHLPTWFQELRVLQALGRTKDLAVLTEQLVKTHPSVQNLPAIKHYQSEAAR